VAGAAEARAEVLEVRIDLANRGDASAHALLVEGELLGHQDSARLEAGVPAAASRSVLLRFPAEVPRPGVHPVSLRLEYQPLPGPGSVSQRAYLLLSLGANPPPAVRLRSSELTLQDRGLLRAELESADGAPHQVRLRVLTPRGLNAENPRGEVAVPGRGTTTVEVQVLRGAVPRPSRQGLLLLAGTSDGPYETTAVATTVVNVSADPAWLPRLRRTMALTAVALLVAAVIVELLGLRARATSP